MCAAVDSGRNEIVHQMCELPKCGLCWLQRKSWHCGDARVMDVLLVRTLALLAMERRTIHSGLSVGGEESR